MSDKPIGVFDSGIGGLSVLEALKTRYPRENYIYLGDTARLPYGTKSAETVRLYARAMASHLLARDVKALVIACNTATAYALEDIRALAGDIPVIGMVEAAADAACRATRTGNVIVAGTRATIESRTYETAIQARNPGIRVTGVACQLLVALAEEGWGSHELARDAVAVYLDDLARDTGAGRVDTLIMGCTHFPALSGAFAEILGPDTALINTGAEAAQALQDTDITLRLRPGEGATEFLVTDSPAYFRAIMPHFLSTGVAENEAENRIVKLDLSA